MTPSPVYCTKIASRLIRTYTDRHGLKDLVREVLNVDLSKEQQSSDWGLRVSEEQPPMPPTMSLSPRIGKGLDAMLAREGRTPLAQACFDSCRPAPSLISAAGKPRISSRIVNEAF